VRLGLLVALSGVGVPVASAALALTEPQQCCVVDFRGWRAVFEEKRHPSLHFKKVRRFWSARVGSGTRSHAS